MEATLPVWSKLCDPIAARAVDAMSGLLSDDPAELGRRPAARDAGDAGRARRPRRSWRDDAPDRRDDGRRPDRRGRRRAGRGGRQLDRRRPAARPAGHRGAAPGGRGRVRRPACRWTPDEIRLFLALREAAHHRLFAHVPWLRARLLGAVEDYARGIKVDASALRDAMPQIDPSNPEALNEALSGAALFQPEDTPEQKAALARLETVLALVEGWVATVVATRPQRPAAAGRRARRGDQAPPRHRRAGRADVRHAGRPGTAAAPAARGGGDLAGPDRRARHRRAGRDLGPPRPAAHRRRLRRPGRLRARPAGARYL